MLVGGSILLTLAINYVALLSSWWLLKKAIVFVVSRIVMLARRLMAKQLSWMWAVMKIGYGRVFGRFGRKKVEKVEIKED